jgi:hypothetical protein
MKFFIFVFLFIFTLTANALTFKSDGSITKNDGTVLKASYSQRYQDALTNYYNNEPIVDWPVVKLSGSGSPIKFKGYMGEKILIEGAPLFAIPNNLSGDPVNAISEHNGLVSDDFIQVMLANSSSEWAESKGFEEQVIEDAKLTVKEIVDDGFQAFKLNLLTKEFMKENANLEDLEQIKKTDSYTSLSAKLNEFYGVNAETSDLIIEDNLKINPEFDNFSTNVVTLKNIIENRTGFKINDHGWTDNMMREQIESIAKETGDELDIDNEIAKINEEAGKAAMDYANSDVKQALEEAANAAREEAINDVAARVAAAEAYVESARAAREAAERAVSEAASEEARAAAEAELERTLLEESGASDNLNNVLSEEVEP